MYNQFPLFDRQKDFLANGIFRAITQQLPEIIAENNLPTSVGSGLFRWNFVNKNLSETFDTNFESSIQTRGAWKLLLLIDQLSGLSFSIMSENNFRKIQRHPSERVHYLEALVSNNKNRAPEQEQISLFKSHISRDQKMLCELRNQLLSMFPYVISEHILILFDYTFNEVTSVRAVLLNPKMEIAYSEDWTAHMKNTFISSGSIMTDYLDDDSMLAKLKPEYDKNIVVSINAEDDKKDAVN